MTAYDSPSGKTSLKGSVCGDTLKAEESGRQRQEQQVRPALPTGVRSKADSTRWTDHQTSRPLAKDQRSGRKPGNTGSEPTSPPLACYVHRQERKGSYTGGAAGFTAVAGERPADPRTRSRAHGERHSLEERDRHVDRDGSRAALRRSPRRTRVTPAAARSPQ